MRSALIDLIGRVDYINQLGEKSPNVLAEYLAACGDRGRPGVCDGDPLWAHLTQFGIPLEVRFTAVCVMGFHIPLSGGVQRFIQKFDSGLYDELNSQVGVAD